MRGAVGQRGHLRQCVHQRQIGDGIDQEGGGDRQAEQNGAGDRRADQPRCVEDHRADADRACHHLPRNERGNDGKADRRIGGRGQPDGERYAKEQLDIQHARKGQNGEERRPRGHEAVDDRGGPQRLQPVDQHPEERGEEENRAEQGKGDEADPELGSTELPGKPAYGQPLHPEPDRGEVRSRRCR